MLAEVYLLKVHLISFLTPHNLYKINKKTHTHTHTHKQVLVPFAQRKHTILSLSTKYHLHGYNIISPDVNNKSYLFISEIV